MVRSLPRGRPLLLVPASPPALQVGAQAGRGEAAGGELAARRGGLGACVREAHHGGQEREEEERRGSVRCGGEEGEGEERREKGGGTHMGKIVFS